MTERYRVARPYRTARRSRSLSADRPNWRVWVSGALLTVSIVFGGGGSPSPMTELVVESSALVAIVIWAWLAARDRQYSVGDIDRPLYLMAAFVVAIPVLQLIPLPPGLWHNLPGRAVEIQALALVGRENAWMPLSESPTRTIASALSLIPPVAMLFMTSRLLERDRLTMIGLVGLLGLAAAVVGVLQLASGNANWFRFYPIIQYGFATGFQANRNADADILLIAVIGLLGWSVSDSRLRQTRQLQLVIVALLLFLVLSVVLTGSRAGVALLAVVFVASAAMVIRRALIRNLRLVVATILGIAVLAGAAYLLSDNARVQRTLGRFGNGDAVRLEIWKDSLYVVGQHWPAGSGIGTFQPIFEAAERLEFVRPEFSNRAHDDYLEFALETGMIAPVSLIALFALAGIRLKRMLTVKERRSDLVVGITVLGSLLVLSLHSLVDYPERSLSLAVVTGMLAGLLGRIGSVEGRGEGVVG